MQVKDNELLLSFQICVEIGALCALNKCTHTMTLVFKNAAIL